MSEWFQSDVICLRLVEMVIVLSAKLNLPEGNHRTQCELTVVT